MKFKDYITLIAREEMCSINMMETSKLHQNKSEISIATNYMCSVNDRKKLQLQLINAKYLLPNYIYHERNKIEQNIYYMFHTHL